MSPTIQIFEEDDSTGDRLLNLERTVDDAGDRRRIFAATRQELCYFEASEPLGRVYHNG